MSARPITGPAIVRAGYQRRGSRATSMPGSFASRTARATSRRDVAIDPHEPAIAGELGLERGRIAAERARASFVGGRR